MKTGRKNDDEINLTELPNKCLLSCAVEEPRGKPLSIVPIDNAQTLSYQLIEEGEHIIYTSSSPDHTPVYRSALVVNLNKSLERLTIMTAKGSLGTPVGVVEEDIDFGAFRNLHKVTYSSSLSSMRAIQEAKNRRTRQNEDKERFHSWNNNSHLFVTWCKTGREDPLTDILNTLRGIWYDIKF